MNTNKKTDEKWWILCQYIYFPSLSLTRHPMKLQSSSTVRPITGNLDQLKWKTLMATVKNVMKVRDKLLDGRGKLGKVTGTSLCVDSVEEEGEEKYSGNV